MALVNFVQVIVHNATFILTHLIAMNVKKALYKSTENVSNVQKDVFNVLHLTHNFVKYVMMDFLSMKVDSVDFAQISVKHATKIKNVSFIKVGK